MKKFTIVLIVFLMLTLTCCGIGSAAAEPVQTEQTGPVVDTKLFECIYIDGDLYIYRDNATDVEYIVYKTGGITPRIDMNGNPYSDW